MSRAVSDTARLIKNMPRQTSLVNNEFYHLCLRAVGDTTIFVDKNDYYRGVFSIYEFNNANWVSIWKRRRNRIVQKKKEFGRSPTPPELIDERDKFVKILAFSLMPNHIHLLVSQLKDNGISSFMQKVGGGYANYFNKKYVRKGHLFNQFRAIHIKTDEQFQNVFIYIHTNRISLIEPGWKENGIKDIDKVTDFLENDKWHSYPDYLGSRNFPSVTDREFILEITGGSEGCRQIMNDWIKYKKGVKGFDDIIIE